MDRRPPNGPLGERLSVTFEIAFEDRRRRQQEEVVDIVGPWVARAARRLLPAYDTEGWSGNVYPGRTYAGWWFGSIEVYLHRRIT